MGAHPHSSGPMGNLLAQGVGQSGIPQVLRTVRKHLGMDVAFVSRFREKDRVLEHVDSDGTAPIHQGQAIPLEDGAVYGTLCCFCRQPNLSLGERDLRLIRALGEVVAARIDEEQEAARLKQRGAEEIRRAMAGGAPRIVYQPSYSLASGTVVGVECLSRFDVEPRRAPDVWFNLAREAGVGLDLELRAIENALAALDRQPAHLWLALNCSPELILSGRLAPLLPRGDLSRVVLEITEHASVPDYAAVQDALAPFRKRGERLAIDDAGAGDASMRHILRLKADVIKLDMSLTHDIDTDLSRRALAKGLIAFAGEVGSRITAEGVETESELATLRAIGVDKAQGYFLSKPQALED